MFGKIADMNLSVGIVGLPNVGKSTLFNALLKKQAALAANYPFATIDPNVGVVSVPDERLEKLALLSHSKKIVPTIVARQAVNKIQDALDDKTQRKLAIWCYGTFPVRDSAAIIEAHPRNNRQNQ